MDSVSPAPDISFTYQSLVRLADKGDPMESEQSYIRYVSSRARIYRRLDQLRGEIDAWLKEIASRAPSMSEVAQLEAYHAERQRLLIEMQDAEERFLDHLVRRIGNPAPASDGATPLTDGATEHSDRAAAP